MRLSILDEIEKIKEITNVIILTYNIDFLFFESLVLKKLNQSGFPTITILADAHCAHDSYKNQQKLISQLGKRYRVVPIFMDNYYRFHPKAVFLSSNEEGHLFVGSGNLSYGGYNSNAEIWTKYNSKNDSIGVFSDFHKYIAEINTRIPDNKIILNDLEYSFDSFKRNWGKNAEPAGILLGKVNDSDTVIDLIQKNVNLNKTSKIILYVPYYDFDLRMLIEFGNRFKQTEIEVLLQKDKIAIDSGAVKAVPRNIKFQLIDFRTEEEHSRFMHAKFYSFVLDNDVTVFSGSANCSQAALNTTGSKGNAELICISKLTNKEFQERYLEEIQYLEGLPSFQSVPKQELPVNPYKLTVLNASFSNGIVTVHYRQDENIEIIECVINGIIVPFDKSGNSCLTVRISSNPLKLYLKGKYRNTEICSNVVWIDDEAELSITPALRAINSRVLSDINSSNWNIGTYSTLLNLISKNLSQNNYKGFQNSFHLNEDDDKFITITKDDGNSTAFGIHLGNHNNLRIFDKLETLQALLLQFFGVRTHQSVSNVNQGQAEDDDIVIAQKLPEQKPSEDSDNRKQKKSILRTTKKILEIICSDDYLFNRSIPQLASDLKIIYILTKTGLNEKWLPYDEFMLISQKIFSILFFVKNFKLPDSESKVCFLDYLLITTQNRKILEDEFRSNDMKAVLIAWIANFPNEITTKEQVYFSLSVLEAIAKYDWIFNSINSEIIELFKQIMVSIGDGVQNDLNFWNNLELKLNTIVGISKVLQKTKNVFKHYTLDDLIKFRKRDIINAGTTLWQTEKFGFCVSTKRVNVNTEGSVELLLLDKPNDKRTKFSRKLLMPLIDIIIGLKDTFNFKSDDYYQKTIDFIESCSEIKLD